MQKAPSVQALMAEADLEQSLADLCRASRLLRYHTFDSRKSPEGFPDDVIIRGDTLYAWELKDHKRMPTPEQIRWLEAFRGVRKVDARIIRPADLDWAIGVLQGRIEV